MGNKFCSHLILIVLLLIEILGIALATTDYCDKYLCPEGVRHLACNNNQRPSKRCYPCSRLEKLNEKARHYIVRQHNKLRNEVAGGNFHNFRKAARMRTIVWNDELAFLAELRVKQCKANRTNCLGTDEFPSPGENTIYSRTREKSIIKDIGRQFRIWRSQYKYVDPKTLSPCHQSSSEFIDNFLQIITDHADYIGCAMFVEPKPKGESFYLTCLYSVSVEVCQRAYKRGEKSGSRCKTGKSRQYPNLCSRRESKHRTPSTKAPKRTSPRINSDSSDSDSFEETTSAGERPTTNSGETSDYGSIESTTNNAENPTIDSGESTDPNIFETTTTNSGEYTDTSGLEETTNKRPKPPTDSGESTDPDSFETTTRKRRKPSTDSGESTDPDSFETTTRKRRKPSTDSGESTDSDSFETTTRKRRKPSTDSGDSTDPDSFETTTRKRRKPPKSSEETSNYSTIYSTRFSTSTESFSNSLGGLIKTINASQGVLIHFNQTNASNEYHDKLNVSLSQGNCC